MTRLLANPYFWALSLPMAMFLTAIYFKAEPDHLNIGGRAVVFGLLAYVAVRYVGTAPRLVWKGDWSDEARNVTGWGMSICAMMLQQVYGALYIIMERPVWLSSQYWGASFVVLMCVGLALVVSSVPRFWPFGGPCSGMSAAASLVVGLIGAGGLLFVQHLPAIWKAFVSVIANLAPHTI